MNYIKHLNTFFQKSTDDARLRPAHISLYMALFQIWNLNRFEESMMIFRNELMKISKISSNATYHKCITELSEFGYIDYLPSYNPLKGSVVKMKEMGNDDYKRHFDQSSNFYPEQSATTEQDEPSEDEEPIQPAVETSSSMQTIEETHQFQIETCVGTGAGLVEEPELVPNTNVLNYTKHLNVSLKKTAPKAVFQMTEGRWQMAELRCATQWSVVRGQGSVQNEPKANGRRLTAKIEAKAKAKAPA